MIVGRRVKNEYDGMINGCAAASGGCKRAFIPMDRMDMSWIWRARIDKRCCDVRDVEETVTKDTGSWRAIASGGGATLRLRKVAPVGGRGRR